MKLSDFVFQYIASLGVKHVFYLPGGGAMHLDDSLCHTSGITPVCMIHEQGCSIAAEAYARISEGLSVCCVTTGPGTTNALTGLAGAWLDATPVLFISGQVKRADLVGDQNIRQFGIQELNIVEVVRSITKYAVQINDPTDILYEMKKALTIAREGKPGPVWIDIPLDVQASEIDPKELRAYDIDPQAFPVSAEDIAETIRLLNKAHRPVLLLGNGIRQAKALNKMRQLIDLLNIPVLTTWNGVDLIEDSHPCFFGRPGASGQRHANLIQQNADFVLSIGSRLNLLTTGFDYDSFIAGATHVMVEIDPYEMKKKSVHPTLAIHADAASFLKELLAASDQIRLNDLNEWIEYCKHTKKRYPYLISEQVPEEDKINTYQLIDEISSQMTENDIYQFTSSGTGADIAMQAFRIKKGQRAFLTKGLASMGFDLPASIGSCLASGGKRTVCVTGDGGFLMNIQELATLYSLELPVKIFLLDNNGYGMIYNSQAGNFHRLSGCTEESGLHIPDLIEISKAFGFRTRRITQASDLQRGIAETLSGSDPVICAVSVSIAQKILPRQTNYRLPDGRMASRPLEDMTPLLSREELKQEMEISTKMIKGE